MNRYVTYSNVRQSSTQHPTTVVNGLTLQNRAPMNLKELIMIMCCADLPCSCMGGIPTAHVSTLVLSVESSGLAAPDDLDDLVCRGGWLPLHLLPEPSLQRSPSPKPFGDPFCS